MLTQESSNSASIGACYRVKYSLDNESGCETGPVKNGNGINGSGDSEAGCDSGNSWTLICSPNEDSPEVGATCTTTAVCHKYFTA